MSPSKDKMSTIWPISPHTAAKHDLLRNYLGAWFAILGQSPQHPRVNYIDGFAGPGIYEKGEPGSPVVALRALLEHKAFPAFAKTQFNFLFNEQDPARLASLPAQVDAYLSQGGGLPPNVTVQFQGRNFHELGEEILSSMGAGQGLAPTFFFVDPFGYKDVPLSLLQRLLRFRSCEMLTYFDFNSVNRFATAGQVDEHFEALFGTDDFKNAPSAGPSRHEYLRDLYEQQLRDVGNFSYVRSFAMVKDSGHVGYYLYFCTRDLQAFDKMKAQMWRLDPSGAYRFADRLAGQTVLFGIDGSTDPLKQALRTKFAGKDVSIETIVEWVKAETPYHGGQVKLATLKPMQKDGLLVGVQQAKEGQFPAHTVVRFN